jgi:hypothetical protein
MTASMRVRNAHPGLPYTTLLDVADDEPAVMKFVSPWHYKLSA